MKETRKTPVFMGWDAAFEQHKEIIDEQHRSILGTINSIHYLYRKGDVTNIIKHIFLLHAQLKIHFQTELLVLKEHESPQFDDYEQQANAFLDELIDICDVHNQESQAQLLFEKFKVWWQSHLELHEEITPYLFDWEGDFCKVVA